MKIAIVSNPHFAVPPKKYGGTENVVHYLIKGLMEKGHEPILLAPGDSKVECELLPIVRRARPYPKFKAYTPAYQLEIININRITRRLLRSVQPRVDIIHSMGFDLKNFQDFPNVTTLHNMIQFEDIDYYKQRKDFPYVSISNNQRGSYPDLNYVRTVYNGEDPAEFPINEKPQSYFSFLGRFDREKAPHLAIQLAINLGVKIKLAGKLDYHGSTYFREEVKPYLDHPLVEYLGEVGFEEKVRLLSNASLNLHPLSWREPFGLTVIEAGYCGTPTMAIRRGSMPEVIDEGKSGYLVEDFTEGVTMVDKCLALDRASVAKNIRHRFNNHKMTQGYIHAYRKVIRNYKKN